LVWSYFFSFTAANRLGGENTAKGIDYCQSYYMENNFKDTYPSMKQAIFICGFMIMSMFLFFPIMFLSTYIGADFTLLLYYIFVCSFTFYRIYREKKRTIGPFQIDLFVESSRVIPLIILVTICIEFGIILPILSFIPTPDFLKNLVNSEFTSDYVPSFVLIVIAAPVFEELIFRSLILDGLLERYSHLNSILASSFLFGFVHLNPQQFVVAFIIGIFMGWVYLKTRSVVLTMIIHATLNFVGFISIVLNKEKIVAFDETAALYGGLIPAILIISSFLIVGSIGLWFLNQKLNN
jgi:membrane protease YdiL (CAAX protease family)